MSELQIILLILLGFPVAMLFVYIAGRVLSSAWFKSKQEFFERRQK